MSVSSNRTAETPATAGPGPKKWLAGAGLAVIPVGALVIFGALLLPRAAPPDELPLPRIDRAALGAVQAEEKALAEAAERNGLGPDSRVLGTELRAYHALQVHHAPRPDLEDAKVKVEKARAFVVAREGLPALHALFSVQQERFLNELAGWERTRTAEGAPAEDAEHTQELDELGGVYLQRLRDGHWADARHVTANDDERRVLYKMMWGNDVGLDGEGSFALSKDERRVLYALFLRAPHPPEVLQPSLQAAVARAKTKQDCELAENEVTRATAKWRVGKIQTLAEFDPDYPKHYALGIAQLEAGDVAAAAAAFRTGLDENPDGPYALRSRNLLKYAMARLDQP